MATGAKTIKAEVLETTDQDRRWAPMRKTVAAGDHGSLGIRHNRADAPPVSRYAYKH